MLQLAEATDAVLHDDHRAVDDEAEVQRPQAHQIPRDAGLQHAGRGHQHHQRDDCGGDQRRAQVAEQQEQHDDDQKRAFGERFRHRADGAVHQRRAVVDRPQDHAVRQGAANRFDTRIHRLRDLATVGADQHEHRAQHDLLAVLGGGTGAQLLALLHGRDVGNADDPRAARRDHHRTDRRGIAELSRHAHQHLLAALLDVAGADVGVAALQRIDQVIETEVECDQPGQIGSDLHLPGIAADRVDLDDSRHRAELRLDHPVLQGAQVGWRPRLSVLPLRSGLGFDGVHVDLAQAGGDWPHRGLEAGRQLAAHLLQAFGDLLSGPVDVGAVLEHDGHLRKPIARQRARVVELRNAGKRRFHWKRHALLGLEWRVARRFGVDLHLHVGDVRHRVDR